MFDEAGYDFMTLAVEEAKMAQAANAEGRARLNLSGIC